MSLRQTAHASCAMQAPHCKLCWSTSCDVDQHSLPKSDTVQMTAVTLSKIYTHGRVCLNNGQSGGHMIRECNIKSRLLRRVWARQRHGIGGNHELCCCNILNTMQPTTSQTAIRGIRRMLGVIPGSMHTRAFSQCQDEMSRLHAWLRHGKSNCL